MLPYNKRPKSDPSTSNASKEADDLGDETLVAKDPLKTEALARARARGLANAGAGSASSLKDRSSGGGERPRLFQDSLSEDDVTRLMPSTRDVGAAAGGGVSKPTLGEFVRARPAAGKAVEIERRVNEDELATNVFDQPEKNKLAHGRRPVLASPAKATLLEPAPDFMDGSDERLTLTNEFDSDGDLPLGDTGEQRAAAALEAQERAKRAPAAFARVEPVTTSTAPHPFAPRPATPLAAGSGAVLPAAAASEARIDAGTTVTGSRPAVAEGRSMGAWAVAFAAVVLLVAGGAFAALKNPGGGSEAAVSLVDPMTKGAAAQPMLPPAPQPQPVVAQPPVLPPQPVVAPQASVAPSPQPEPPAALPAAAAPPPSEPVAASAAATHAGPAPKGPHHAAPATPAPKAPPVAAAPPAPKAPPVAAAPPAPKAPKEGKKGMSDEEKKLSDEAKALADKQLQQSL